MHPETNTGSTTCPYCPMSFHNLANLKIHLRGRGCPNRHGNITTETWKDITKQNPILHPMGHYNIDSRNKPKPKQRSIFKTIELQFGRIRETDDDPRWQCCTCQTKFQKPESLRGHLAMCHRETESKDVYCPYCEKYFKHIGNLKQHFFFKKCTKYNQQITANTWNDIVIRNKRKE